MMYVCKTKAHSYLTRQMHDQRQKHITEIEASCHKVANKDVSEIKASYYLAKQSCMTKDHSFDLAFSFICSNINAEGTCLNLNYVLQSFIWCITVHPTQIMSFVIIKTFEI